ncbi:MAG: right-handed parallel beta-helix repeat-containing protein [Thermoguttaceae bacterium]|jgi:parallel beta-helix repeat protein
MGNRLLTVLIVALSSSAQAAEWFVSPLGNDTTNFGKSETSAFQTIAKAETALAPGDTLTLLDGTYPVVAVTRSGAPNAWITVRAKNPRKAILSLELSARQNPGNPGLLERNCLSLANVSYVKVIGLSVQGWNPKHATVSSGHGINVQGCHHILIRGCRVKDCSGSGISGSPEWWTGPNKVNGPLDFITIEDNEVSGCAFWNQYQCHGISLWKAHSAGFGADPSGFNCVIRRNISYGNENKVGPWGGPVAKATDGNGVILDCNNDNAYPHATLVEGNLVFNNGGRGIHVLRSDNVTARYNTSWHNNRCRLDGTWKQGELESDGSAKFHAEDNIAAGNTNAWSAALALHSLGPAVPGVVLKNNLLFAAREVDRRVAVTETGTLRADPRLVNPGADPAVANFRLQAGSPAIHAADATPAPSPDLAGTIRPQGPANDLGAYKFVN